MIKNKKVEEDAGTPVSLKVVRGTTSGPVMSGGGPAVEYHTHDFRYEVVSCGNGMTRVIGVTDYDAASGSSHAITDFRYTTPADDNHYHALPVEAVTPTDQYPKPEFDILSVMAKEDKEVAEKVDQWVEMITNEMVTAVGDYSYTASPNSTIPNPLGNPKGTKANKIMKAKKSKRNQSLATGYQVSAQLDKQG